MEEREDSMGILITATLPLKMRIGQSIWVDFAGPLIRMNGFKTKSR
jgi:hypothetical protein